MDTMSWLFVLACFCALAFTVGFVLGMKWMEKYLDRELEARVHPVTSRRKLSPRRGGHHVP
jgi:hypothetical protein